jgi:murein DD-endopeptidase MepM/ murein hydrolase activator NlpD
MHPYGCVLTMQAVCRRLWMRTKFRLWMTLAVMLLVAVVASCQTRQGTSESEAHMLPSVTPPPVDAEQADLESALQAAIATHEDVITFLIYHVEIDHIQMSSDRMLALLWLKMIDPQTSELVPAELGLAIAKRVKADSSGPDRWQVSLQVDENWVEVLKKVPESMLAADTREKYMPAIQQQQKGQVFGGYRLPWEAGRSVRLSGSIGHVFTYKTCPSTCLYAFDFADGTMFPVLAAKAGRVKYAVWKYVNGNNTNANYLVLEDTTTNPVTYQVYYHLAQDSIPQNLRALGAEVVQGQFIGNADDTGPSSGHHLHFHVHTNKNAYWGTSVDITFEDVKINGGRPRTCAEANAFATYGALCAKGDWFTSNNGDNAIPTGGITAPLPEKIVKERFVEVSGWGKDDNAVKYLQLLASSDGTWKPVGPLMTETPFTTQLDLCEAGIPDGPFLISLQVIDKAGKRSEGLPGLRLLYKQFNCAPEPTPIPKCSGGDEQAVIYQNTNMSGVCQVLDIGEYADSSSFGVLGDNQVGSVQLGANVLAYLYTEANYQGNEELLLASDPNLNDNPTGASQLSAIKVQYKPGIPLVPVLNIPRNPLGEDVVEGQEVVLTWEGGGDGVEYHGELKGPGGYAAAMDWTTEVQWPVGSLPAGQYTWQVWAKNLTGEATAAINFNVVKNDLPSASELEPLPANSISTAILLKWKVTEGKDDLHHFEIQYKVNGKDWKTWDYQPPANALQAWFMGVPGDQYDYRIRSVDMKGNQEDYPDTADTSTHIDSKCSLDAYEGKGKEDNVRAGAAELEVDSGQDHTLCAKSDIDWVIFPAEAGTHYRIRTIPQSGNAAVIIQLLGFEGNQSLGVQKPKDYGQMAELNWTAPEDGLYYLKLEPLHPDLTGPDVRYQVRVDRMANMPVPAGWICGGSLVPLLWALYKLARRLQAEINARKNNLL